MSLIVSERLLIDCIIGVSVSFTAFSIPSILPESSPIEDLNVSFSLGLVYVLFQEA
jgi:hypothetical protein